MSGGRGSYRGVDFKAQTCRHPRRDRAEEFTVRLLPVKQPFKESEEATAKSSPLVLVRNSAWNSKHQLGANVARTQDGDLGTDSCTAFLHALESEMSRFSFSEDVGIDPNAVVFEPENEVIGISKFYTQVTCS